MQPNFKTVFSRNRTEELGADVYKHFVVPLFYDQLDLRIARKPRILIGGRGCGKTMLLRYLSHHSTYSLNRKDIPHDEIDHVGLYWRVDTQFAAIMTERGIELDVWDSAFNHFVAIQLSLELLDSITNIAISACSALEEDQLKLVKFEPLVAFDATFGGTILELKNALRRRLWEFELWVANVRKAQMPTFLPGASFLKAIISLLNEDIFTRKPANFFVYVDEFENLLDYQQRILNTFLKHSQAPLIFNIAMKRHGFVTKQTVGPESIQDPADYREYDLEKFLLDFDFNTFAAEVLFQNLALAGLEDIPIRLEDLRNPGALPLRREQHHQDAVQRKIRAMLPGYTHEELAANVFTNETLLRKLKERISQALRQRGAQASIDSFCDFNLPQASIITPALINRSKLSVDEISTEFNKLRHNQDNKFTGSRGWVHNNFIGCLLWLYDSHSSPCPLYSGFDTFCLLAKGNLRHFLELCHLSLSYLSEFDISTLSPIHPDVQAKAAREASTTFLNDIPSSGRYGDRLHTFVFRLGSLLALAHRRPSQSEPEQSHFAITSAASPTSVEDVRFFNEAEKWSVIFQEEETKVKHDVKVVSFEYVLNPIYAPYFNITYRKKRQLGLSQQELEILMRGSFDEVNTLLRKFSRNWKIDDTISATLFFRFEDSKTV